MYQRLGHSHVQRDVLVESVAITRIINLCVVLQNLSLWWNTPGNAMWRSAIWESVLVRKFLHFGFIRLMCTDALGRSIRCVRVNWKVCVCYVTNCCCVTFLFFHVTVIGFELCCRQSPHVIRPQCVWLRMLYGLQNPFCGQGVPSYTFFPHLIHQLRCFIADLLWGWINYYQLCYNPNAHCLTTGQWLLRNQVLHGRRSSASSFNLQYLVFFLRSFSSCLRLLPRLPFSFSSLNRSFYNVSQKAVPTQYVTNPVSLPSFYCL